MAILVHPQDRKLFALLCQAAGVDQLKVKAIECRCAVGEFPTFAVELIGEQEKIGKALESKG